MTGKDADAMRARLAEVGEELAAADLRRQRAMAKVKAAVREAEGVLPIKQIAEIVGVTRPTVYKLLEVDADAPSRTSRA